MKEKKQSKNRTMLHHKNMKRACRRCASMTKLAAFMMGIIFLSGLLNNEIEDPRIYQGRDGEVLLRHERRYQPDEKQVPYDVTVPRIPPTLQNPTTTERTEISRITQEIPFNNLNLEAENQIRPKSIGFEPLYMTVNYDVLKTKEFKAKEKERQSFWRRKIKLKEFDEDPPNPSFIFHNKLPKSGSSTMNNILKKLSKENRFNFYKMETSDFQTSDDRYLIKELKSKLKEPYLLLKHHRWLNFTRSNQAQPTYINVMRDPIEWFTSRYYFSRYGWERKPGCRDCNMGEEDLKMEIDDCVKKRHRECLSPWMYIQFFCGTAPACYNSTTLEQKEKATEIAKYNILNEYYVVGVLEQFEDTLNLFHKMMPKYFKNAIPAWKSDFVQTKQRMTRTIYKKEMSEESKNFFRYGPLHYEMELYNFARELFNEKLKHFHIQSTVTS